jgi:nicotinate-nucleotide adenylyltransferase
VRVALLGGTFDPPHIGHLLAASDAFDKLGLDHLVFVPNCQQPLKPAEPRAPAQDRLEMVRRLCHGDKRFTVDGTEVDRGGLSFTVDTLREYRARYRDAALFLLIGDDVVATLPSWRDAGEIHALAEVVVLTRGEGGASAWTGKRIASRRVDVSSTEIRERVRQGKPLTGFVPDAVAAYISERKLYL